MSVKLNLLRKLVRELIKKELEEASMTGNIDGGAGPPKTPKAFKKKKKNQDESGFQDGHEDPTVSTTYRKVKEAIQLPQGMKLGKVFTGHGKSFVKEESVNEAIAKDVPFNNFDWPADKNKIKKLAKKYGLKVVKVSQGPNYEPTAVLKGDEKKLIKFLTGKDYGVDDEDAQDMIESVNEGQTQSIDGKDLLDFLMKRFKMSKSKAIATMKKQKMDLSFLKKESVNESDQSWAKYYSWRNDKSMTPKQKIGMSMREVRDSLQGLERIINRNIKLKKELKVGSNNYWKSTHSALRRIHERLVKLTGKIASLY